MERQITKEVVPCPPKSLSIHTPPTAATGGEMRGAASKHPGAPQSNSHAPKEATIRVAWQAPLGLLLNFRFLAYMQTVMHYFVNDPGESCLVNHAKKRSALRPTVNKSANQPVVLGKKEE